jgi:hypothetical protein
VVRELKNLARVLKQVRKTLLLTSHTLELPAELMEEVTVIHFPLPIVPEINYLRTYAQPLYVGWAER